MLPCADDYATIGQSRVDFVAYTFIFCYIDELKCSDSTAISHIRFMYLHSRGKMFLLQAFCSFVTKAQYFFSIRSPARSL
jgi:hypothetical protein